MKKTLLILLSLFCLAACKKERQNQQTPQGMYKGTVFSSTLHPAVTVAPPRDLDITFSKNRYTSGDTEGTFEIKDQQITFTNERFYPALYTAPLGMVGTYNYQLKGDVLIMKRSTLLNDSKFTIDAEYRLKLVR